MTEAHRIARLFRAHHATYREALAYGLSVAWKSNWSARVARSLSQQVSRAATAAAPVKGPTIRRQPMLGSYAYVGA
jgi:hypothetical protein